MAEIYNVIFDEYGFFLSSFVGQKQRAALSIREKNLSDQEQSTFRSGEKGVVTYTCEEGKTANRWRRDSAKKPKINTIFRDNDNGTSFNFHFENTNDIFQNTHSLT